MNFQMRRFSIIFLICSIIYGAFPFLVFAQTDSGSMLITAVSNYNDGKYASAAKMLDELISQSKDNDAAWYYRGMCAVYENDRVVAETCFKKAVELDGKNFWYRYRLASLYVALSEHDMAISM